jgi:hypothetical protein
MHAYRPVHFIGTECLTLVPPASSFAVLVFASEQYLFVFALPRKGPLSLVHDVHETFLFWKPRSVRVDDQASTFLLV